MTSLLCVDLRKLGKNLDNPKIIMEIPPYCNSASGLNVCAITTKDNPRKRTINAMERETRALPP
jgi:hypothetical protein